MSSAAGSQLITWLVILVYLEMLTNLHIRVYSYNQGKCRNMVVLPFAGTLRFNREPFRVFISQKGFQVEPLIMGMPNMTREEKSYSSDRSCWWLLSWKPRWRSTFWDRNKTKTPRLFGDAVHSGWSQLRSLLLSEWGRHAVITGSVSASPDTSLQDTSSRNRRAASFYPNTLQRCWILDPDWPEGID